LPPPRLPPPPRLEFMLWLPRVLAARPPDDMAPGLGAG
jgi:hypothetical protein